MKFMVIGVACSSLLLAGCETMITRELRHPGGYSGHLLDRATVDASKTKSVQLFRAAIIIAMASRMATVTVRDGAEADAFAAYLEAAVTELNYAASNIYEVNDVPPCSIALASDAQSSEAGDAPQAAPADLPARPQLASSINCEAFFVNFEADVPLVEARILRLMIAALPEEQARKFMENARNGNVMGAAWSAIRTFAAAIDGLRHSAAVFRSGMELTAELYCPNESDGFSAQTGTVMGASRDCFRLSLNSLLPADNIVIENHINEGAFHPLMLIARTSCVRMPISGNNNDIQVSINRRVDSCKKIVFEPQYRPSSIILPSLDAG